MKGNAWHKKIIKDNLVFINNSLTILQLNLKKTNESYSLKTKQYSENAEGSNFRNTPCQLKCYL